MLQMEEREEKGVSKEGGCRSKERHVGKNDSLLFFPEFRLGTRSSEKILESMIYQYEISRCMSNIITTPAYQSQLLF